MKIGVVGASGFIGSYLVRYVLGRGCVSLRMLIRNAAARPVPAGAEVLGGDLLSSSDCEKFVAGLDVIYYLAHVNSPVNSDADLAHDAAVNLIPFLNLLNAVRRVGSNPHIVYFSSGGAVYEPRFGDCYAETHPCVPRSSYGIQKLTAEHYLRMRAEKGHLTAAVLRVGNAYGALLPQYRLQGLIGVAVNNILHNRPVRVFGSLNNVRDYVHLEDVCAFAEIASRRRGGFDVFNVASGQGYSVAEILHLIGEIHGERPVILSDDSIGGDLVDWVVLDISKALRETGWQPAVDLKTGVARMLAERRLEMALSAATADR